MNDAARSLYADLAREMGLSALTPDGNGGVQLAAGGASVALFATGPDLVIIAPVAALPKQTDHGLALWLLRRNFYDSDLAPFMVGCDQAATIVLWGRVAMSGLDGARLAGLVDAVGAEAARMRAEVTATAS